MLKWQHAGDGLVAVDEDSPAPIQVIDPAATQSGSINVGASLSGAFDCGYGMSPRAILLNAAAEGTQLSFQASANGVAYAEVNDETGSPVLVAFTAGAWATLTSAEFSAFRYWKVRTGTVLSPTLQVGATATLTLQVGAQMRLAA